MSRATKQPAKSIFDHPAVKRVTAWALLYRESPAGNGLPPLEPRRPYDDEQPDGYLESDLDYVCNNVESAVWLLDGEIDGSAVAKPAGRILIAYPDDGAGIVRAYVEIYSGPLAISWERPLVGAMWEAGATLTTHSTQGSAGGYGYDKASAAVADACDRLLERDAAGPISCPARDALSPLHGRGMSTVRAALESHGYQVVEVL